MSSTNSDRAGNARKHRRAGLTDMKPAAEFLGDRIPPNDMEAERIVLSAMMQEPEAAELAFEDIKPEDFYHDAHSRLFTLMLDQFKEGRVFDYFTIKREAEAVGLLDALGGDLGFINLTNAAPNAAMIREYAHLVRERAIQREAITVATQVLRSAYDPAVEGVDLLDNMEKGVHYISERHQKSRVETIGDLLAQTLSEVEEARATGQWNNDVLPTGYFDLDEKLGGGFHNGELILLAARPSVGKTTMALNFLRKIAATPLEVNPTPVMFFSLEMPAQEIANHILCADADIPGSLLRRRMLDVDDAELIDRLYTAQEHLTHAPIYIDDGGSLNIIELRSKARQRVDKNDVRAIFVDYLQLMTTQRAENRNQEISMLSRQLKQLARELEIPFIVLSQLRRPEPSRSKMRPVISDLRESGALEQDADVVLLLHREDYQGHNNDEAQEQFELRPPPLEVIIGKNRNGETGKVNLSFFKEKFRIESYSSELQYSPM